MNPDRSLSLADRKRVMVLVLFSVALMTIAVIKSFNKGWFEPKGPLEFDGRPALIFFTLGRGCVCQMLIVRNAETQLAEWLAALEDQVLIFRVDFDRRSDLAQQYGVRRAPALVLLDSVGRVVWKQDVGLSDEAPFNLAAAEVLFRQMQESQK